MVPFRLNKCDYGLNLLHHLTGPDVLLVEVDYLVPSFMQIYCLDRNYSMILNIVRSVMRHILFSIVLRA